MKLYDLVEDGRIVKGVNTTVDVDTDEIKVQAAKFGNTVDKDGFPPTHKKKVKGSTTNVLFNLGLTEGYKLQLERDRKMLVLNITNTETGRRTEVRGKPGYESGNYDPNDNLHQLLDTIGKSANISELMNGEVVTINPKHPDAEKAKAATDKAYSEARYTAYEWALMEGGHSLEEPPKKRSDLFAQMENFADGKKKINEALDNPYPFTLQGPDSSHNFVATAETPNGVLRMDFQALDYDDFGIDFAVAKSMGKTGAGDEFRTFATVVAMMKKWINVVGIEHVESFDFSADKSAHTSDGRVKLYARFAKQLANQLGWKLVQKTTADRNAEFFRLTNPKPVPRDDDHWDDLEDNPDLEENFADGKRKGKSRPGRFKKAGVSCKGSVTSLRKKAKNSSGERQKGYHWCANMKSGRKKK